MELMQESDSCREELEEEEEAASASASAEEIITREESTRLHQHQDAASNFINHTARNKQLDFMDLSLGTNHHHESNNFHGSLGHYATSTTSSSSSSYANNNSSSNNLNNQPPPAEKEHMFDKVVTPSDVGKLNRLVIPKQHAEKYFPLDSSANEKGLLLNFEDRNGKLWRFRYSYWNSSQSYVMTKGWSRFVKEKKLDAGDIVSFQRGVGELYRHRLYIDWRRRPEQQHHHHLHHGHAHLDYPSSAALITPFFLPNQQHLPSNYSLRWGGGGRLYSLPQAPVPPQQRSHHHDQQQQNFQQLNYNNMYPFHQQQQHHGGGSLLSHHYSYNNEVNSSGSGTGSVYYLRSTTTTPPSMQMADTTRQQQQQERGNDNIAPMIIDSVPVAHHPHHHHHHHNHNHYGGGGGSGNSGSNNSTSTAAKRLRLFGVNMECSSSTAQEDSSSLQALQLLNEEPLSSSAAATRFGDQRGGEAAMYFDLDPSLQYHHQ